MANGFQCIPRARSFCIFPRLWKRAVANGFLMFSELQVCMSLDAGLEPAVANGFQCIPRIVRLWIFRGRRKPAVANGFHYISSKAEFHF